MGCRTKKRAPGASEQDRRDVAAQRKRRRVWQRCMDPHAFVFLGGEAGQRSIRWIDRLPNGASTNMVRRYGRSARGERLVDAAPHEHWKTTTFLAGLRSSGIVAPLVLDGPVTGAAFLACVEQFLVREPKPGGVVMDNLAAHKGAGVAEPIRAAGASLTCLPA